MTPSDLRGQLAAEAERNEARMNTLLVGAHTFLFIFAAVGIGLAVRAGIELADTRAAYGAGTVCVVLAGQMVIAIGGVWLHLSGRREERARFEYLAGDIEAIKQEEQRRFECVMTQIREVRQLIGQNQEQLKSCCDRQVEAFREVVDAAERAMNDELSDRRHGHAN